MIRINARGQAIAAQSVLPPGAIGFDPKLKSPLAEYEPAKAKALLDTYGYIDRDGDGWREQPDGKPLQLVMASPSTQLARNSDELWKKSMTAVGLRIDFRKGKFQELIRDSRAGKLMMFSSGWSGPMPDGEYFMGILYGPNAGQSNQSRFDLPEFNRLFAQAAPMPDGPERESKQYFGKPDKYGLPLEICLLFRHVAFASLQRLIVRDGSDRPGGPIGLCTGCRRPRTFVTGI